MSPESLKRLPEDPLGDFRAVCSDEKRPADLVREGRRERVRHALSQVPRTLFAVLELFPEPLLHPLLGPAGVPNLDGNTSGGQGGLHRMGRHFSLKLRGALRPQRGYQPRFRFPRLGIARKKNKALPFRGRLLAGDVILRRGQKYRREDLVTGAEYAADRAGNLRASDALPVIDGGFHRNDSQKRGLDLHLDCPAVVGVSHAETLQGREANRPEGPEIRVPHAPEKTHKITREAVAEARLRRQRAGLGVTQHPGADDHLGLPPQDRIDQSIHLIGVVAEIPVEKHDDVGRVKRGDAFKARGSVSAARFMHDPGAMFFRDRGRAVLGAVIGDDDFVDPVRNGLEDLADGARFVEGGDDDRNAGVVAHVRRPREGAWDASVYTIPRGR